MKIFPLVIGAGGLIFSILKGGSSFIPLISIILIAIGIFDFTLPDFKEEDEYEECECGYSQGENSDDDEDQESVGKIHTKCLTEMRRKHEEALEEKQRVIEALRIESKEKVRPKERVFNPDAKTKFD